MQRPKITDGMILEAAEKIAAQLDGDAGAIAKRYHYGMDGYELARALDRHDGWDLTMQEVEILDDMTSTVSDLHRKAEKEWGEIYKPQPSLPMGTRIKQGVIDGIYEYAPGKYKVKENGCTDENRRLLVNFEDAQTEEVGSHHDK